MLEKLQTLGRERCFEKRSFLFTQGQTGTGFYLVLEGLLKAFYETRAGKQYIKTFVQPGGFIASVRAIVDEAPSPFGVICLEKTKVREISGAELRQAAAEDPEFISALNSVLAKVASKKELREYELLCLSAEERYLAFREREPDLWERLSQEDVAGYLGITPVSLCRIRKRIRLSAD